MHVGCELSNIARKGGTGCIDQQERARIRALGKAPSEVPRRAEIGPRFLQLCWCTITEPRKRRWLRGIRGFRHLPGRCPAECPALSSQRPGHRHGLLLPHDVEGPQEVISEPTYSTGVGLLKYAYQLESFADMDKLEDGKEDAGFLSRFRDFISRIIKS